ncbi:MAG: penicillin-binding protein 2, partial [Paludibacteraceae bacterium]|nr:penicillin-binding protein 2 [Paludibacteraceae bacterium]
NRGYWIVPHFLKSSTNDSLSIEFKKRETSLEKWCFDPIIEGMEMAVNGAEGSTARIAKIEDIVVCGKTGTAQNPHGEDHSLFMAFAPKDNPKIAIAVIVENAGFGATWAAPIGSLMIEKYLKREISPKRAWIESHITNADFVSKYVKEN